jgi:hypothetical protein
MAEKAFHLPEMWYDVDDLKMKGCEKNGSGY